MKIIYKKIIPQYFNEVQKGIKDFEIRKDDSDYEVGDFLVLQEGEHDFPIINGTFKEWKYTGNEVTKRIKYKITSKDFPEGIKEGYCILGLEDIFI
jgi:hypothetical protein